MIFKISTRTKWLCAAFIVFTIANLQISLLVVKYYSKQPHEDLSKKVGDAVLAENPIMLSNPFSSTTTKKISLPSFAKDETEFVFGALIERHFDLWDLHITIFMLCHHLLSPDSKNGAEKVHPVTKDIWKQAMSNFRAISYTGNGQRKNDPAFYCRIKNSDDSSTYIVPGEFVPNRLTSDTNANRRLDTMRCAMENNKESYLNLIHSKGEVLVEILRENEPIMKFGIPWTTRKTGYMFSSPLTASKLDAWKGFESKPYLSKPERPFISQADDIHICVPDTKRYPSKDIIPLYLEFVSHHLLLGASHIYLPVSVGWKSAHMDRYLELFRSYIDDGKLSLISHSGDGVDMVHSVAGLTWNRLAIKVFQVNKCLYEAKGVAENLLVIDIDEFFIPRLPHTTISQVIRAAESPVPLALIDPNAKLEDVAGNWTGGRGWADGDAHPFCYLTLSSEVYLRAAKRGARQQFHPWIGERYKHGSEPVDSVYTRKWGYSRAILPTRKMFQGGLSSGGACLMPQPWAGCQFHEQDKTMCGDNSDSLRLGIRSNGRYINFRSDHTFHETVLGADTKKIDRTTEAVLYHYLIHRQHYEASETAMSNTSEYSTRFFPHVLKDLQVRNLDLVMVAQDLPTSTDAAPEEKWPPLFDEQDMADHMAALEALAKSRAMKSAANKKTKTQAVADESQVKIVEIEDEAKNEEILADLDKVLKQKPKARPRSRKVPQHEVQGQLRTQQN